MVSASTGALLVPHLPGGQLRLSMLFACYAMFGLALCPSLIVIGLIWLRLATGDPGAPALALAPTVWIVLGPLGQSITAANLLGAAARGTAPEPYADALRAFGVAYGAPTLGFAALCGAVAFALTCRVAREGLPFALSWWSFTFPIGTVVTGTSGLAASTGADLFRVGAFLLFCSLLGAWCVVAGRTARECIRGRVFLAPGHPA
jgi:tellurite resistance protein TehA-like permease